MKTIELSEKVKEKLSSAVEEWADENLVDKPAILAYMLFSVLENTMLKEIKKISETFEEKK